MGLATITRRGGGSTMESKTTQIVLPTKALTFTGPEYTDEVNAYFGTYDTLMSMKFMRISPLPIFTCNVSGSNTTFAPAYTFINGTHAQNWIVITDVFWNRPVSNTLEYQNGQGNKINVMFGWFLMSPTDVNLTMQFILDSSSNALGLFNSTTINIDYITE